MIKRFIRTVLCKQYFILLVCLCALLLATSCKKNKTTTRGFYYWKTVYNPTPYEDSMLKKLHCSRMYVRCFDIEWNDAQQQTYPESMIRFPGKMAAQLDYVPVFFITQKALVSIPDTALPALAKNTAKLLENLLAQAHIHATEIQVDCDWTASYKDKYFALLKELKKQSFFHNKIMSATIRLHQVKYISRNGVPPVDKGMLMCYNMGDLKKPGDHNSILDVPLTEQYLGAVKSYPLKLDVALPLFSWNVLFRNNQFAGILRGIDPGELKTKPEFLHQSGSLYLCKKAVRWHDYWFKQGDVVRAEELTSEHILAAAKLLSKKLKYTPENICLFHCDSTTISEYAPEQLDKIFAAFN